MATKPSIFSSPSRYVQGQNAINELGTYLKQLGTNPLLLADDTAPRIHPRYSGVGTPLSKK